MLNKAFRNNGFVISVGNGLGSVLFPCPIAGQFLRNEQSGNGINWSGCGNYGYNDTSLAYYDVYTDGNCGEYLSLTGSWNRPAGDVLYDTGCCQVIWDGSYYYVDDNCNPCGDADTLTGSTRNINVSSIYWDGCSTSGYFDYAYDIETEYHDGYCGTYWLPSGSYSAENGTTIYSYNDCCYVYYDSYNYPYYTVSDNCNPPCPDAGATGNTRNVDEQYIYWDGCGTSGQFTYNYNIEDEYADGMCGTYWMWSNSWSAMNGDIIYDNGCCQVIYSDGSYYVNDNCNEPPPPDYPPAGTVLNYSESPINQSINYSGNDMDGYYLDNQYADVNIGTSWGSEIADGMGGSTFEWGSNYLSDGAIVFTPSIGSIRLLDWYVSDGGGSYSGQLQVGLDVTPWVMSGQGAIPSGTSFLDKFQSGYIIFESNEFWNGDANVKTRVEYQSGGGYITTTITF
jgi:hypothetical protein